MVAFVNKARLDYMEMFCATSRSPIEDVGAKYWSKHNPDGVSYASEDGTLAGMCCLKHLKFDNPFLDSVLQLQSQKSHEELYPLYVERIGTGNIDAHLSHTYDEWNGHA